VAEGKHQQSTGADKAAAARKAEKRAEKVRADNELRERRGAQLESAKRALECVNEAQEAVEGNATRREALSSHLDGFYAEIDKPARGKALVDCSYFPT